MKSLAFFWSQIVEIYKQAFSMFQKTPTLLMLFFWIAVLDLIALFVLFFAPSAPLSYILAPIIRTFWSDAYLHYPSNFLLLPKLFNHAHFVISTVFGVFITGLVIKKIEAETKGEHISTLSAARPVLRYYIWLVIAWLISYGIFSFALKGVMAILPKTFIMQAGGGLLVGIVIQSFVVFLLPAIILMENGFFKSLAEGFRFGFKNLAVTAGLIFIPMLFAFMLSFTQVYTPFFVRIQPELVLWVLAGGIFISLFIDILITSSATLLFLKVRNK